jgi:hypothetical protein
MKAIHCWQWGCHTKHTIYQLPSAHSKTKHTGVPWPHVSDTECTAVVALCKHGVDEHCQHEATLLLRSTLEQHKRSAGCFKQGASRKFLHNVDDARMESQQALPPVYHVILLAECIKDLSPA